MKIPIIIVAYNRCESLNRLLKSLSKAEYGNCIVDLIISIDKNNNNRVYKIAEEFTWNYGEKIIIRHNENLGLRKHVLSCGDIALKYDAVIMLEDDLYVSRYFYKYALQAVSFYQKDSTIAGISLYTYRITEFSELRPFIPIQDDSDTYFIQVPSSWGQIWTKDQWTGFKNWYENREYKNIDFSGMIPDTVLKWPESSWKKYFHMYLRHKNKFFVYPRIAFSTNMGDIGTHNLYSSSTHQSILMANFERKFIFKDISDVSAIKYDAFFENINIKELILNETKKSQIVVDYFGLKRKYTSENCLLSIEKLNYKIIKTWGLVLVPYELNIFYGIDGNDIYLYDLSKICERKLNSSKVKVIKYENPSITKEKAWKIFSSDCWSLIKRKLRRIFPFK